MTNIERRKQRPEGWEEVKAAYNRRELTFAQAAEKLGISQQWFNVLLRRDEPGRKTFKAEHGKNMGRANKKYTTYIEKHFSDYIMCKMIRLTENCDRCPNGASCKGEKKNRGIVKKMLERVPINDQEETKLD